MGDAKALEDEEDELLLVFFLLCGFRLPVFLLLLMLFVLLGVLEEDRCNDDGEDWTGTVLVPSRDRSIWRC